MQFPLRVILFLTIRGGLYVGAHVYLYRRWAKNLWRSASHRRWTSWALGSVGLITLVVPVLFDGRAEAQARARLGVMAALVWTGFVMGVTAVLLVVQGLRWLFTRRVRGLGSAELRPELHRERRMFLSRAAAGTSVLLSGLTTGFGMRSALGPPEVTEVPVRLPRLPRALSGLSIVQLSDLHIGAILQEDFLDRVVEVTNRLRPDAVVITGDLVDGSISRLGPFVARLQRLRSRWGTFFITGNHDYYSGADSWCDALRGLGMQVLRNRRVLLGDVGASIDLLGVDDWGSRHSGRGYDLAAASAGRDPERASILLAHQPSNFEVVAQEGIGLQLSGHTHGGQVFPFTQLVRAVWPYSRGLHTLGESSIYVSRGTGFVGPPMRVQSPPEIVHLILT